MLNLPQNPKCDIARVSHSTLVNADCFDVFPFIETGSIDAIICDLPYGTTQNKWDSVLPLDKLWNEYKRILKPKGVVILFAQIPFSITLGASNLKWLKYEWIWEKDQGTGHLNAKKRPMKNHENILVFYEQIGTYNPQKTIGHKPTNKSRTLDVENDVRNYGKHIDKGGRGGNTDRYPTSIFKHNTVNGFSKVDPIEHPTQKPLGLIEMLVKTYTNEGDMILDNTCGSGTTNLAALKLNRKSIGIEKEKQYYDVAVRRLFSYCG